MKAIHLNTYHSLKNEIVNINKQVHQVFIDFLLEYLMIHLKHKPLERIKENAFFLVTLNKYDNHLENAIIEILNYLDTKGVCVEALPSFIQLINGLRELEDLNEEFTALQN